MKKRSGDKSPPLGRYVCELPKGDFDILTAYMFVRILYFLECKKEASAILRTKDYISFLINTASLHLLFLLYQ
jgi:hypothetical protein